jgi:RNA polymerase sigma-70 factor, ECF subfamily
MKVPDQEFAEIYRAHVDALFQYCLFKVSDRELAKDLVQETFMKTWIYAADAESGKIESMKAFLFRTLSNLIVDEYRKRKTISLDTLAEDGFDPPFDDSDRLLDTIDGERALQLLKFLPEDYRDVVFMRYVQELSLEEIAEITGESKNTLSVRLHRGIKKLKEHFDRPPSSLT